MKYLSLFSGIGGFEVAIHSIYPSAECLGFSEINQDAINVYLTHFPNHKNIGDVRNINGKMFKGKIDLLVGGSPCQDFSKAGKKKGLDGNNGKLIHEFLRILKETKPKYFILENVKLDTETHNLVTEFLNKMYKNSSNFSKCGIKPYKMNSRFFVPQNRIRYIWTNIDITQLPSLGNRDFFIEHDSYIEVLFDYTDKNVKDILLKNDKNLETKFKYIDLNNNISAPKTVNTLKRMINGTLEKKHFFSIIYPKDNYFHTLTTQTMCQYIYINKNKVRYLHPIECERIQGFPDNYTKDIISDVETDENKSQSSVKQLSYNKRFKLCGNAITTYVIAFFVNEMYKNDLQNN